MGGIAKPTWVEVDPGPITTLTLQSGNGLNLLSRNTIQQLQAILENLRAQPPQVLILTGGGSKAFCAGANMRELIALAEDIPAYVSQGEQLMETLFHFPAPVIAALNGYTLGAGFSMAMACEIRLAAATAHMGQLAVRNALIPPFGDTQRLLQTIGPARAKELIYTGRILPAQDAFAYGLLNRVCPPGQLLPAARALAEEIAGAPDFVLRKVKDILNRSLEEGYAVGYLAQEEALIQCLGDPRTKEIMQRFFAKEG